MGHNDVSDLLYRGMEAALDSWALQPDGELNPLYWVLRVKAAESNGGAAVDSVLAQVPDGVKAQVKAHLEADESYWDNIRYANLDRITQLWGVVVNAVRVVARSPMATKAQQRVFDYPIESLVAFFRAARQRMEVADQLYHCFKPMPAPECQALAALLNVHVVAPLDDALLRRLVRLLDAEGPITEAERADMDSLSQTGLVDAAFRGMRGQG